MVLSASGRLNRTITRCRGLYASLRLTLQSPSVHRPGRSRCMQSGDDSSTLAQNLTTCTIQISQDRADDFADALLECGAQAASVLLEPEESVGTCAVVAQFGGDMPQSSMQSIVEMSGSMAAVDAAGMSLHWQEVSLTGWQEDAAASAYMPVRASERLWVVPEHSTVPPEWHASSVTAPTIVRVHPTLAFGSGDHPTTRQCLQWLAHSDIKGCSVVDYGCGSGVLGIAASMLGALEVGYDIEEQAVEASVANAELNGVADACSFHLCSPDGLDEGSQSLGQFDVCIANIFQGDLLALQGTFSALVRPGGKIIMSGILDGAQAAAVTQAFHHSSSTVSSRSLDGWALIEAIRK